MTASGGELCSNQIAAFADRHFFVKKEIEDKRTVTRVKVLEGEKPPNQLEEEQRGQKRAEYGEYLIRRLAKDLTKQFGKGFTERNLWWMKQFYITYPKLYALRTEFEKDEKLYALRTQLSWTHFRILMNINFLIRRISFVTPENERKRLLKKFKKNVL